MKEPALVTATQQELDELLALARTSFPHKQYQLLEGVLGSRFIARSMRFPGRSACAARPTTTDHVCMT